MGESGIAGLCFLSAPLMIAMLGLLGGWYGGKSSAQVLRELDANVSEEATKRIINRSTLGFMAGGFVGGILFGIGLAPALVTPFVQLAFQWQWAMYVALGFSLMGAIGAAIAGSALFRKE